jgi:hypothetical protein
VGGGTELSPLGLMWRKADVPLVLIVPYVAPIESTPQHGNHQHTLTGQSLASSHESERKEVLFSGKGIEGLQKKVQADEGVVIGVHEVVELEPRRRPPAQASGLQSGAARPLRGGGSMRTA